MPNKKNFPLQLHENVGFCEDEIKAKIEFY